MRFNILLTFLFSLSLYSSISMAAKQTVNTFPENIRVVWRHSSEIATLLRKIYTSSAKDNSLTVGGGNKRGHLGR